MFASKGIVQCTKEFHSTAKKSDAVVGAAAAALAAIVVVQLEVSKNACVLRAGPALSTAMSWPRLTIAWMQRRTNNLKK